MSRCWCDEDHTCVSCEIRRDDRRRRRDVGITVLLLAAMVAVLGWAQGMR